MIWQYDTYNNSPVKNWFICTQLHLTSSLYKYKHFMCKTPLKNRITTYIPFLEYIILASGPILHFLETLLERKEKKRSKHANKSPSFKFFTFNALLHSSFSSSVYSSTSLQSLICYLKP